MLDGAPRGAGPCRAHGKVLEGEVAVAAAEDAGESRKRWSRRVIIERRWSPDPKLREQPLARRTRSRRRTGRGMRSPGDAATIC